LTDKVTVCICTIVVGFTLIWSAFRAVGQTTETLTMARTAAVIRSYDRHQPKSIIPRQCGRINIRRSLIGRNHIPRPPIHRHQPVSRCRHIGRIIDREGDATCPHLQARRRSADLVCTDRCRARRNHRHKLIRSSIGVLVPCGMCRVSLDWKGAPAESWILFCSRVVPTAPFQAVRVG
jgi:hypothetical protein